MKTGQFKEHSVNALHWWMIRSGWGCYSLATALGLALVAFVLALPPLRASADTWDPTAGTCTTNGPVSYTVPPGTRFVLVDAIAGSGFGGATDVPPNDGGIGGTGAEIGAFLPVSPGQQLKVAVGHNGGPKDPYTSRPNGMASGLGSGEGGGSSVVTTSSGDPCLGCTTSANSNNVYPNDINVCQTAGYQLGPVDRNQILVLAGGGGGGGGGNQFSAGGAGGNAGVNLDLSGKPGQDGLKDLPTGCAEGHGGGGGSATAPGSAGTEGCFQALCFGTQGEGFFGGSAGGSTVSPGFGDGGSGGGGWYGGGSGSCSDILGGGGGGAGSSYVTPAARFSTTNQDMTAKPSVTITPIPTPTTAATLSGTTSGNDWFTTTVTVTLTAQAGGNPPTGFGLGHTYYAVDNSECSATNLTSCQTYSAPFSVSTDGLHTLTYFSVDLLGLDEAMQTKTFSVEPTTASVSAASIGSGSNPTANTGGSTGVTVSGSGTGTVGAAVYGSNPAGTATFNSSDAYVDVTVAGSGLTSLTVKDCDLNSGTTVSWWNGTTWVLASNQTYDATAKCVTITVNSTTSPSLSQITGTPFGAGSPPTITAIAKTADGKAYTSGTWTNQSVTVTFTCSANATATAPVTRSTDGANQTADGTCTDGVGQKTSTTFTGIDVDKTPPTCSVTVSPTTLWPPNGKPVAISGTVTAADTLSGIASVVGGTVTANEMLAAGDVQGFAVNTTYAVPLKLSASVSVSGQLVATRAGSGNGRTYAQTVTVTDQAGNTNTTPCTWSVTVPHDQGGGH
jgi:hypothetical protein